MFIVLLDEPGLFVFSSASEAQREIEPLDAETEVRAAFDDSAIPYRVDWVIPNQHERFFFTTASINGEYRFVPAGPANRKALITLLEQHPDHTNPPEARVELSRLLISMRSDLSGIQ